jgi:DNA-binding NarL/FixJ family response regulator
MRDVMTLVLKQESDMKVVGFASTIEEVVGQLHCCNVVLVSAGLPDSMACEVIETVARVRPRVRVMAIDVRDRQAGVFTYMAAGASDYVLEEDSVDALLAKVRSLHNGNGKVSQLAKV